jgi:hypothetical protein
MPLTTSHHPSRLLRLVAPAILGGVGVTASTPAQGADDFERSATPPAVHDTEPNPLGERWDILAGQWRVADGPPLGDPAGNYVTSRHLKAEGNNHVMVWRPDGEPRTSDQPFNVAADVRLDGENNTAFAGVAFNVQDADNYYAFRFRVGDAGQNNLIQIVKVVDGKASGAGLNRPLADHPLAAETFYRLEVASTKPHVFDWKISAPGASGPEIVSGTTTDRAGTFRGGDRGLYSSTSIGAFDNFSTGAEPQ